MKKLFGFRKKKGGGADGKSLSKASSEISLSGPGYAVREKDLGKLHKAAWLGDLDKVKQFAKKDASPLDKENRTPLHLACSRGHSGVVQELLEWRAKINIGDLDSRTPLLKATQCHQLQCVELLLEHRADPNTQDTQGETCVHYAARDGVIMILEVLLKCGNIHIDIQSKDGKTAIMVAVLAQQVRSIKMLLQNGADPDLQDIRGRTALMLACNADDAEIVRLLLDGKASIVIKDMEGWTAFDLAEKAGHQNCLKVLSRYTTQSPTAHKMLPAATSEESEDEHEDEIGDGAAAAKPAPQRLNNGALKRPSVSGDDDMFGMPAGNEAGDFSAAEDTESKASESGGALDSWNDSEDDSYLEPKKKKPGSPRKAKPPAYEDILEVTESDLPSYDDLVEGQSPMDPKIAKLFKVYSGSDTNVNNQLRTPENVGPKDVAKASSADSVNLTAKDSSEQQAPVSARSAASAGSLGTWSDDEDSLFSSLKEKKPSLLRPPAAFGNNAPPPPIAPKPNLKAKKSEDKDSKWSDSEESPIAKKPETPAFSTFKPVTATAASVEAAKSEKDDDDESSRWDNSQDLPKDTKKASSGTLNDLTAEQRKAMMAELGLDDNVSDVSDPEFSDDEDAAGQNVYDPSGKKQDESEWDSTQASEANTPAAKAKEPPMSARATESKKNLNKDEDEDNSKWDSEDDLPLSDNDAPSKPVVVNTASMKPTVVGGMNVDISDEEEEEESEWEKEKQLQDQQKKAEEERLKKWNEDFERQQEQLRKEAQEELRREKEEAERQKKEQEERERREKEEAERQKREEADRARIEEQKRKDQERLMEVKRQAELKQREMERIEAERKEAERKEQERKEAQRMKEEERKEQERKLAEEKKKEAERKELERLQGEERKKEEQRQAELKEMVEQESPALERRNSDERKRKHLEFQNKPSLSSPSVNKQPNKQGPAVPPKPRGIFLPSPRENHPPFPPVNDSFDDDDTFNNDQIPDFSSPGRPIDTMIGPAGGSNNLPPSGYRPMMNGSAVNGHIVRDVDDDCLSYSSTEQDDVSDHGGGQSFGLGNSANLSFGSDSMSMLRQQEQLRETHRLLDKERSARVSLENKKRHIDSERSEVIQKLEDVTHTKSSLEQEKIKLDAKIRALDYELGQEEAKRKNAETLYNKTKEQLARKEEQYTGEAEARQKSDLNMRNIQMELRTVLSQVKQLEDEKEELSRQLQHERNARLLQEQINEELNNFQRTLTDDKVSDKTEIMSKFEEADENRKHAQGSVEKLHADLYAVKMELERQRNRARDDHNLLSSENDDLHTKMGDLKADLKLNEDALNQATIQYNINLSQIKVENTRVASNWEKEKGTREKLESEVQSLNARLEASAKELKILQDARSNLERQNHKNYEDLTKLLERREHELNNLKEAKENLQERVNVAETKLNIQENELHMVNATLAERSSQVATMQQELEQRKSAFEVLDGNYRKEKEDHVRNQARLETMQEKLPSLQHEVLSLKQQNDELRTQNIGKDQKETQERVSAMLQSLRDEHERARITLEEKNASMNETVLQLKENIRDTETRKGTDDHELRSLRQELKEIQRDLTSTKSSLEVANKTREHLEMDKKNLQAEVERLQNRLETSQQRQTELQTQLLEVTNKLERAEHSSAFTSQQLANHTANAEADARSREEFISQIHQLELVKTRLESALEHESDKVAMLQRELQDANQTLDSLQEQVSLLRSSNSELQRQFENATAAKTQADNDALDNKGLWEAEVKARSKIGLRDYELEIAQLEREKQEVLAQVEEEKKKTRKALELKKITETKLTGEEGKTDQLQKEINNLKLYLRSAKKKLKASKDSSVFQSAQEQDLRDMEHTIAALRQQLDETSRELGQEKLRRMDFESKHKQSEREVSNLKDMDRNFSRIEKNKRKVEEEFALYKAHVANNFMEKSKLEMARAELEAQARMELNKKYDEMNSFLQQQLEARKQIDQMRDWKESEMKREFEKTRKDLRDEINKMKNNYNTNARKEVYDWEVHKYRDMYDNEVKLRERLADKLQKATERAAHAQYLIERQKLLINNGFGSPLLNGMLSPPRYHGVNDDIGYQLRADLDRSINKHLEKGPKVDISIPNTGSNNITGMAASFDKSAQDYLGVLKSSYAIT